MKHYATYEEYLRHWLFRAIRKTAIDQANGLCLYCGAKATEVHHVQYPKPNHIAFDVPMNLRAICHSCHCEIHGRDAA